MLMTLCLIDAVSLRNTLLSYEDPFCRLLPSYGPVYRSLKPAPLPPARGNNKLCLIACIRFACWHWKRQHKSPWPLPVGPTKTRTRQSENGRNPASAPDSHLGPWNWRRYSLKRRTTISLHLDKIDLVEGAASDIICSSGFLYCDFMVEVLASRDRIWFFCEDSIPSLNAIHDHGYATMASTAICLGDYADVWEYGFVGVVRVLGLLRSPWTSPDRCSRNVIILGVANISVCMPTKTIFGISTENNKRSRSNGCHCDSSTWGKNPVLVLRMILSR